MEKMKEEEIQGLVKGAEKLEKQKHLAQRVKDATQVLQEAIREAEDAGIDVYVASSSATDPNRPNVKVYVRCELISRL
jgi:predicted peroxiredoxin